MTQATSGVAGASATAEYERRRQARRRGRLRLFLLAVTLTGVVAAGLHLEEARTAVPFAGSVIIVLGFREAWRLRAPVETWRVGAEGEERTARILERLTGKGYVVLHDRKIPGGRANIDHIVVGPTGVFTIETKNYGGRVKLGRSSVKVNGRRRPEIVDQALYQAHAVSEVLADHPVDPVVCVHRAEVRKRWFRKPIVQGVVFCSAPRLTKTLKRRRAVLTRESIEKLGDLLAEHFAPAS